MGVAKIKTRKNLFEKCMRTKEKINGQQKNGTRMTRMQATQIRTDKKNQRKSAIENPLYPRAKKKE